VGAKKSNWGNMQRRIFMKKRLLSMILALSMMLTILPVNAITALAANDSCGANLTYELTPNTDDPGTYTLTIRGEGAMYDYSSSTVPWNAQKSKITSVVIENGVTSIGNYAFEDCSALKMLDIPQSVTEIGSKAFRACSALTSLALPETVNRIGNTAFQGCSNLETINIPSGVKLIEKDTFHGCEKLNDVTIPAGVTLIGNSAFKACKTFRNINIPKGVTKIDYFAFEDCTQLETVGIPSTATNIRNFAFRNCPKLKSFVFPSGTTQIQPGVLSGCKNLESVTIPEGVTKIWGSAFYGCSLNSVKLPSTLKTICKLAFYGCDQLSEITIPKSVELIEQSAFESSTELKSVMLAQGSVPTIAENAFSKSLGTKTKIYYPGDKAEWFAQNAAEKITDLKTDGVTISAGGKSMDVDICYLCDVTFDANGGMLASGAPAKTQVYRTEMVTNTKANNLKTVDDPSKSEYTFIGWYTSPTPQEGEAAFSLANTPVDPQTEDGNLTLYAVYTTVTISGPTDNTVKAGEGSNVFTVAADKDTGAAKAKFDFAGGKVQYRTGDTEEWFDLTSNELSIDDLTGKQFRVVPDADAVTAQKTLTVKLVDASGNEITGATASTTFAVTARKPAEVTITGLDGTTVKAGKAKDFTVSVTPNDDANTGAKATITVSGADAVEKIQYKDGETWKDVPGEGLSIDKINNTEFKLITKADANDGDVTITVTAKKANGTEIDKKVAAVTVKKHENAAVTIDGLSGTVETDTEKEFTVTVTANDDAGKNVTAKAGFTGPAGATITLKKVQYRFGDSGEWQDGMQELNGMNLDINSLELPFNYLPNITYKLTVTFAEAGNYKFDVSLTKKDAAEAFTSDSAEVTVTKKEEPVTPGGGSTGGGENPGENPGGNPGSGSTKPEQETPKRKLEIADGTLTSVTVKDENGNLKDITDTITKDLDGKYEIPVGAKVTITAKDAPEGMKFGEWSISDKTLLGNPDVPYTEKDLIFTMPDNPDGVKLSVVYLEESIGEEPNLLEKGALAGTVVVGSAALLYQGHMLGTELYLRYLLPHGAVIPQNRAELAVLLWQDAESPEPVSTTLYSDISDEDSAIQQAARWAVENDLMEQLDADDHPDHFDPFVPVTFSDSIRAWKKAQELKKSVH
jgi:uncharacterized repeat protein (TIGR02543 family)